MAPGQQRRNLRYTRADQANLEGLPVPSNSTALMHSEEMFDLGGKLSLKQNAGGGLQIVNQTRLTFAGSRIDQETGLGQSAGGLAGHASARRNKNRLLD